MVQQTGTKSNKKGTVKERILTILAGLRKPSGMICAKVKNDRGKHYFVRIWEDGLAYCTCPAYDLDKGAGHRECYHVKAVKEMSHVFGPEGLLITALDGIAAQFDTTYEQAKAAKVGDAYEQIAEEIVPVCPNCGKRNKLCQDLGRCNWIPTYSQL